MIGLLGAVTAAAAIPAFAHLTLPDALSKTVANSAAVAGAQATVRERQSELRLARLGGIPHLNADYSLAPQAAPTGSATIEQHFIAVGAGISIGDVLATSPSIRQAAAELVSAQRAEDARVLQARTSAIDLYFSALRTAAVATVRRDAVRGAQRELSAARLRAHVGEAPHLDVVRADVTLAQAQADLAQADADRDDALEALASATNLPADSLALGGSLTPPPLPPDRRRAVERALAARPELAALSAAIEARVAGVELARRAGWPAVAVSGGFQSGVDTAVPVHGPQAAVHLDVPLAAGNGDRVDAARAQADAVRAQLAEQQRTIALAVSSAIRDALAARAAQAAAQRARDEARSALSAVELGYREGASSSLDVDLARRTYVQAAVDTLVAEYRRAQTAALVEVLVP